MLFQNFTLKAFPLLRDLTIQLPLENSELEDFVVDIGSKQTLLYKTLRKIGLLICPIAYTEELDFGINTEVHWSKIPSNSMVEILMSSKWTFLNVDETFFRFTERDCSEYHGADGAVRLVPVEHEEHLLRELQILEEPSNLEAHARCSVPT